MFSCMKTIKRNVFGKALALLLALALPMFVPLAVAAQANETSTPIFDIEAVIKLLEGVSIVSVAQADVTSDAEATNYVNTVMRTKIIAEFGSDVSQALADAGVLVRIAIDFIPAFTGVELVPMGLNGSFVYYIGHMVEGEATTIVRGTATIIAEPWKGYHTAEEEEGIADWKAGWDYGNLSPENQTFVTSICPVRNTFTFWWWNELEVFIASVYHYVNHVSPEWMKDAPHSKEDVRGLVWGMIEGRECWSLVNITPGSP